VTDKPIKMPGPDHSISIDTNPCRVVVKVGGTIIADTHAALTLREASYPAVQYISRQDLEERSWFQIAGNPRNVR